LGFYDNAILELVYYFCCCLCEERRRIVGIEGAGFFFLFQQGQDYDHLSIKILQIEKVQLSTEEEETKGHLDREKIQLRRWVWDWYAGGRAIDGDT
jgi:hypothetical protein